MLGPFTFTLESEDLEKIEKVWLPKASGLGNLTTAAGSLLDPDGANKIKKKKELKSSFFIVDLVLVIIINPGNYLI